MDFDKSLALVEILALSCLNESAIEPRMFVRADAKSKTEDTDSPFLVLLGGGGEPDGSPPVLVVFLGGEEGFDGIKAKASWSTDKLFAAAAVPSKEEADIGEALES